MAAIHVGRVRVSVCAARDDEDVRAIVRGGADAVGVLVQTRHVAEDAVDLGIASKLLDLVPPYVGRYAVTHATDLNELIDCVDALPLDTLQVHDYVEPGVLRRLRDRRPHVRLIKALHVLDEVPSLAPWSELCDALIFDTVSLTENRIGGTGKTHDWKLTALAINGCSVPGVLAGGLNPRNVAAAVSLVRPWAVNVNSGVEVNGIKSEHLVQEFVRAANLP